MLPPNQSAHFSHKAPRPQALARHREWLPDFGPQRLMVAATVCSASPSPLPPSPLEHFDPLRKEILALQTTLFRPDRFQAHSWIGKCSPRQAIMPDRSLTHSRAGASPRPAQPACFHRLDEILSALRSMTSTRLDRAVPSLHPPVPHSTAVDLMSSCWIDLGAWSRVRQSFPHASMGRCCMNTGCGWSGVGY